jgi:hypothetical protein
MMLPVTYSAIVTSLENMVEEAIRFHVALTDSYTPRRKTAI